MSFCSKFRAALFKGTALVFSLVLFLGGVSLVSCASAGSGSFAKNGAGGKGSGGKGSGSGEVVVPYMYKGDLPMWRHIFEISGAYLVPEAKPVSLIVPHHDITVPYQNSIYKAVSECFQPKVIVLIGPDHYEKGLSTVCVPTDNVVFSAPDGSFGLAQDVLLRLKSDERLKKAVSVQDEIWIADHAMYSHTPFLKHYFPEAKLLPVLLKPLAVDDEYKDFEALAQFLAENLDEDCLVIASVDFSHYQIPRMTDMHDFVTKNTIQNRESPRWVEVDSPETLSCLSLYNELKGAVRPVLIDQTSTFDFIADPKVESTSHQYWAFYPERDDEAIASFRYRAIPLSPQRTFVADYAHRKNQTILLGGSGPLNAGIRTHWVWDRYKSLTSGPEFLLRDVAGKEARFFSGFDAIIFDTETGTSYVRKLHGTTLVVDSVVEDDVAFAAAKKSGAGAAEPSVRVLVVNCGGSGALGGDPALGGTVAAGADGLGKEVLLGESGAVKRALENFGRFAKNYDVILCRSDNPLEGAVARVTDSDGSFTDYELGTAYDPAGGEIKGMVLALNWYNGNLIAEPFPYEGVGTIPPIEQFLEE